MKLKNYLGGYIVKFNIWQIKRNLFRSTDPRAAIVINELFPDGEPTTDEFVIRLVNYLREHPEEQECLRESLKEHEEEQRLMYLHTHMKNNNKFQKYKFCRICLITIVSVLIYCPRKNVVKMEM